MSKDAKESKHRPEGLRQPQRKDSLSSILSWAALQSKITAPKTPTATTSTSQPPQSSASSITSRRHSHGSSKTDTNTKARRGSTTSRRLSLSSLPAIQDGAGAKTRHAKASATPDPKPSSPGASRSGKNNSSERVNKATCDSPDAKTTSRKKPEEESQEKPSSPTPPKPKPKSILRSPVPDGTTKRPEKQTSSDTSQPSTPDADSPPSPLAPVGLPPDSPPSSPPMSPLHRPMSPGTTVRFAKATIHRVELGPGPRRFLPVKRKSKSTLTYLAPLDPGAANTLNGNSSNSSSSGNNKSKNKKNAQQLMPSKTVLQNPIKLRRHQENQAAMGRYWLRTEEEEAQWRVEAERRAREEAERYRNEPASPPPVPVTGIAAVTKMATGTGIGIGTDSETETGTETRTSAATDRETKTATAIGVVEKGGDTRVGKEGALVGNGAVVQKVAAVEKGAAVENAAGVEKAAVVEKAAIVEKAAVVEEATVIENVTVVKVEEFAADEDALKPGKEAGAKCDQGLDGSPAVTVKDLTELKASTDRSGPKTAEVGAVKAVQNPNLADKTPVEGSLEVKAVTSAEKVKEELLSSPPVTAMKQAEVEPPRVTPVVPEMQQAKGELRTFGVEAVTVVATSSPELKEKEAVAATTKISKPAEAEVELSTAKITKAEESTTCSEKADQVAGQKAETGGNASDQSNGTSPKTEFVRDKTPEASLNTAVEEKQKKEAATGQKRRDSTESEDRPTSNSVSESPGRLTRVPSSDKAEEAEGDREKTKEKEKAKEKPKTAPVTRPAMPARSGGTGKADRAASRGSNSHNNSTSSSHSQGHGHGSNHLHLSGRRGRRYSDHKEGITA